MLISHNNKKLLTEWCYNYFNKKYICIKKAGKSNKTKDFGVTIAFIPKLMIKMASDDEKKMSK
jgi:hypothetical protein